MVDGACMQYAWSIIVRSTALTRVLYTVHQEYIIRKEGRVSYSVYARANALRIIKFLHSLEDATITTLTNHTGVGRRVLY